MDQKKNSPTGLNISRAYPDYNENKQMYKNYLKMISDAIREGSDNQGTLRKYIWDYLN